MIPYWALFLLIAAGASTERFTPNFVHPMRLMLLVCGFVLVAMIGLRFEVGGDWASYEFLFDMVERQSFSKAIDSGDPGYQALSWILAKAGARIWMVNTFCGLFFVWGLFQLARNQPAPLLAILVALPYLIIVVAMGYTRQAVAIGFVMAGLAAVERGATIIRFGVYVVLGMLFHRTAIIALPIVMLANPRNRSLNILAGVLITLGLYSAFVADSLDSFVKGYIEAQYQSQGAVIRVAMNVVPSVLMLLVGNRLYFGDNQYRVWRLIAIFGLGLVPALLLSPSSTAIDRLALYVLPLQIVVLPRIGLLLGSAALGRLLVIAYSALVLSVWLIFAEHSRLWVPYSVYPVNESERAIESRRDRN